MMADELKTLEVATHATSAGPWDNNPQTRDDQLWDAEGWLADFRNSADAAFCALARNAMPQLLAHVRELRALLDEARTSMSLCSGSCAPGGTLNAKISEVLK